MMLSWTVVACLVSCFWARMCCWDVVRLYSRMGVPLPTGPWTRATEGWMGLGTSSRQTLAPICQTSGRTARGTPSVT